MKQLFILVLSLSLLLLPSVFALSTTGTVNWDSNVGQIRSDFYGANVNGYFVSDIYPIFDGTYTNSTWHSEQLNLLKITDIRVDAQLKRLASYNSTNDKWVFNKSVSGFGKTMYNISIVKTWVDWAKMNDKRILFVMTNIPNELANKTSGYCTLTDDNSTCMPYNYTRFGNLVVDYLEAVGCNGDSCEVEVWNEPEATTQWLNNLSATNNTKSIEYNKLFNATYLAINNYNSSIVIYGPVTGLFGSGSANIWQNFMGNFSYLSNNPNIGFSFHEITTESPASDVYYSTIIGNCTTYNFNCENIYSSEWKHKNSTEQNTTSLWNNWGNNIALTITNSLKYPTQIKQSYFSWSSQRPYNSSDWQYPLVAKFVSEPKIENIFYPPYNITKLFANNHKALNYVVTSSITDSTVKIVASYDANFTKYITLTNTNTSAFNVTLYNQTTSFINVETNATYSVNSSGAIIILNMPSYGVYTLKSYNTYLGSQVNVSYTINYETGALADKTSTLNNIISGFKSFIGFSPTLFSAAAIILLVSLLIGLVLIIVNVIKKMNNKNVGNLGSG